MKFILIPDSFKGTLSSSQICAVMDEKIKKHFPDSLTVSIPVADGGEGSVDAFITAVGGVKEYVTVKNPYFEDMESYFGLIDAGQTAVIEMASCAGLPLVEDRKDPRLTTTYGVGQLILAAASSFPPAEQLPILTESTCPEGTAFWSRWRSSPCAISTIPCTDLRERPLSSDPKRERMRPWSFSWMRESGI